MSKSGEVVAAEQKCQDCKYHKNRPSKCKIYGFVGRKETGCNDWRKA